MRIKTSITLAPETLRAIDALAEADETRSEVIERAVLELVKRRERAERDAREMETIDRHANALNGEVSETLELQVSLTEAG